MRDVCRVCVLLLLSILSFATTAQAQSITKQDAHWTPTGWGGGGFYYSTVFDPFDEKVLYLGSDVLGCYRSDDHGKTWKIINNGIASYGVFSLAADPSIPGTIYAASTEGLCKSVDRGETWTVLPNVGPKQLHITGEKNKSIRCIAVDPSNSQIVYAASPAGKLYKSVDGGMNWTVAYQAPVMAKNSDSLRVQFGKVNGAGFGGAWLPVEIPSEIKQVSTIGLTVQRQGDLLDKCYLTVQLANGARYNSSDFAKQVSADRIQDIHLKPQDFAMDGYWKSKNAQRASQSPEYPDLSQVKRIDLCASGKLRQPNVLLFFRLFVTCDATRTDILSFTTKTRAQAYGNTSIGQPKSGSYYSVAVAANKPGYVAVATADEGVVLSSDHGQSWTKLDTPVSVSSVCFAGSDSQVMLAACLFDGIYRSDDLGKSWIAITPADVKDKTQFRDITVDPNDPQKLFAIGSEGWSGVFVWSHDGGQTWQKVTSIKADLQANPTVPGEVQNGQARLSIPTNIAVNPNKTSEIYISTNWRPCMSYDGGKTLVESSRGADISCVTDIRFDKNGRVYAAAMDEGTLYSDDNGKSWHPIFPMKYSEKTSGHHWRIAVDEIAGKQRVLLTCSPWSKYPNRVILSNDAGKTFDVITQGLPDYIATSDTMWGRSYARALAVDPNDPNVIYMGMDGAATKSNPGGGVFKSIDGGKSWEQLPNQPQSRRMFFGLMVDPTDSKRIYWGATGGLFRSENAGQTWERIFTPDGWVFNLHVTSDGTVYCGATNLYRSTNQGKTWQKISNFPKGRSIVGLEVHPDDPATIWVSSITWGLVNNGAIYKTADSGKTWLDITGDIPFIKPLVLRFNPKTSELWAGNVGLYKIKQ